MTIISPISTLNTASTTAQTIINGALRLLQVASTDVVLTADEANDALEALNQMIDGWSNESLMLYHVQLEQFTCVPGLNPHTIGYGGNFNTAVPIHIEASTVTVGGVDYVWNDNVLTKNGKPYTGSVAWADGTLKYKNFTFCEMTGST